MKKCAKCEQSKPLSEYYLTRPNGPHMATCKECKKSYVRKYRDQNIEVCRERERLYSQANSKKRNAKVKEFHLKNPGKSKEYQKRYTSKPEVKEKLRRDASVYMKKKISSCMVQRLKLICRSRIHIALRGVGEKKTTKTFETIGCSPGYLIKHLEEQFSEGMSWDNYGEWHIDHIIPLCKGKTKEGILELSHYTNLQPLWAEDNFKKGGRYEHG